MSQTKAQLVEGLNINTSAPADALVIDSSGNLGLGTSSPVGKAYISGPNVSTFGVAADAALNLAAANGALVNRVVNLNFACVDSATNAVAAVGMKYTSQSGFGKGDLIFGTRSVTTDTAPTERLRISSTGLVGIATASPTKSLEVAAGSTSSNGILVTGASSPQIRIEEATGVTASLQLDSAASYFGTASNHSQVFRTNNVERARLDSAGNLNVGTTGVNNNFRLNVKAPSGNGGIGVCTGYGWSNRSCYSYA